MTHKLKEFEFIRSPMCDIGGWEMDSYICSKVSGTYGSERGAIIATLLQEGVDTSVVDMDDFSLDQICLSHNLYVKFIDE